MALGMASTTSSSTKLIFILVLRLEIVLTTCMEHHDQVHNYLISSKLPYDNYYNISKAVYPSVDPPSLLINITVTFLATADNSTGSTLTGSFPSLNDSKRNDSRPTAANFTRKYMWSMSCLYVSGGNISLTSMNIFSLGAIWPNRRTKELYITLPQFCSGSPSDPDQENTMLYFLSTLQDIAVARSLHDPRINTVECVITGHEKASHFSGLKQLLHGVCWSLLFISLVMSMFVSHWMIMQLRKWDAEQNQSKIVSVTCFSLFVCFMGVALNISAWVKSSVQQDLYVRVFFGFVLLVLLRRAAWCMFIHRDKNVRGCFRICISSISKFNWDLTSGHGEDTSKNFVSCFFLYPAVFMACHHLLWISLGIITEPFWGITILVGVISTSAAFCFLVCEFHKALKSYPSQRPYCIISLERFMLIMSAILFPSAFVAFVLLLFIYLVVAQAFLSESLISAIVQNGLVTVVALWLGYLKLGAAGTEGIGGGEGGGGGGGRGGGKGREDGGAGEGKGEERAPVEGEQADEGELPKDQEHIHLVSINKHSN